MNALERRLVQSPTLPTIPRVAQRLLQVLEGEEIDLAELAELISLDPGLSVRVIRLINSPMYGLSREIVSLRDAVLYLGLSSVRSVALSFSFLSAFSKGPEEDERVHQLWHTSLMNALATRRLAAEIGGWDPEEAFLTGLVTHCGVVMMLRGVAEYAPLLDRFLAGELDLIELERRHLETTHPRLGSLLLEAWRFPTHICETVARHHDETALRDEGPAGIRTRTLLAAWMCARDLTVAGFSERTPSLEHRVSSLLGIPVVVARDVVSELPAELRETAGLFDIAVEEQLTYPELLTLANESLSRLALEAEQSARELADVLAIGRNAFKDIGDPEPTPESRDAETGLLSTQAFERLLQAFQRRAREIRRPIGVMLLKVDSFKSLVERRGREIALEVLARIGDRIGQLTRGTDHRARLAEDEIALVVPGCSGSNLVRVAERIRFGVEDRALDTSVGPLCAQLVLGLAVTQPHKDAMDAGTLIRFAISAAERAALTSDRLFLAE